MRQVRSLGVSVVLACEDATHLLRGYALQLGDHLQLRLRDGADRHDHYGAQIFAAAVERAGLPAGTTSHDLRHHDVSELLAAGESVVAVAERLGQENASLVLSTYGHLIPHSEERTRRAIDEVWRATTVASVQPVTT